MLPLRFQWVLLVTGLIAIYLLGLMIPVMDVDAAQYASMSREMLEFGHFLQVKHWHQDYLDKPPLLFWLSSLSFYIFGIGTVSYKLPSFLFTLLGIYSTYRLASLFYDRKIAVLAGVILATCQAIFLMNNDVRTDTILTGAVVFSVWQLATFLKSDKIHHLFLGSVGIGLAMLTKGPIGLVIPVLALGGHWLLTRQWNRFFDWRWFIPLAVIGVMLTPMCYGLYQQFGMKGIKFYFWTQSFGRITGESRWKNDAGPFFFVLTMVWAFLPWTFILFGALADEMHQLIKNRLKIPVEGLSLSAFLLTFVALSLSHYKLPHYIFVLFPFASVLTAKYLYKLMNPEEKNRGKEFFRFFQPAVNLLLWVLLLGVAAYVFPLRNILLWVTLAGLLVATVYFSFFHGYRSKLLTASLVTAIGCNLFLNGHFYPNLLEYQPAKKVSEKLSELKAPNNRFFYYKTTAHSLDFYVGVVAQGIFDPVQLKEHLKEKASKPLWLYIFADKMDEINALNLPYTKVDSFDYYKVSNLKIDFLNPETRASQVKKAYLLQF